ncbi:TonB-dependent receptor plug domain-containing protein [Lysobacter tyrosinilyticus]
MANHYKPLRRSRLMLSIFVALSAPAWAQDATTTPTQPAAKKEQAATATDKDATTLDTVMVTASRIPRAGFDTLEPATVLSGEQIRARGLTNVADALNETVGFGPAQTPEGGQANFATGVNFVNRFGLDSNRTLTLVNGRRVVTSRALTNFGASAGLQVDLNAIPTQLVDRVENVTIGGAPTYGSDAIAGVVNIVLKDHYEGAEVNVNYGISDRGDNETLGYSFIAGSNFGPEQRGNLVLSGNFGQVDGLLRSDREDFANAYAFATNPNAAQIANPASGQSTRNPTTDGRINTNVPFNTSPTDGIPGLVLIQDAHTFTTTYGGLVLPTSGSINNSQGGALVGLGPSRNTYLQFDPNGNLVSYNPGVNFGTNTAVGGDGLFTAPYVALLQNQERYSVNLTGQYDLTDRVRLFWEGTNYHSENTSPATATFSNATTGTRLNSALLVRADHPLLNAQARAALAAAGISGTNTFRMNRTFKNMGLTPEQTEGEINRWVVGAKGDFDLGSRTFGWEVSANYGRMHAVNSQTALNHQNFINAINNCQTAVPYVTLAGFPAGSGRTADPACVAVRPFGEGEISQAAKDYITDYQATDFLQEQQVYSAFIHGDVADLWAGPLAVAAGYEYRQEEGGFSPNDFTRRGLGRSVAIPGLHGKFHTNEYYGEVLLPLASPDNDIPGLHSLNVTGKFRHVNNSVNGGFNAYTYGLQWEPIEGLLFRGNKTRSLRAPVITELFLPPVELFQTASDPCATANVSSGPNPTVRQRNCNAFYAAYGLNPASFQQGSGTVRGARQGEPELRNESADSWTAGVVWQPEFVHGLRVAVDYNKIKLTDQIFAQSVNDVLSACYDNPDFNAADVNNANAFCSVIRRQPGPLGSNPQAGQFDIVQVRYRNGDFIKFGAWTGEVSYRLNAGAVGDFTFDLNGQVLKHFESSTTGVTVDRSVGEVGTSKRQYALTAGWNKGHWGVNAGTRYLSSAEFDLDNNADTQDILRLPSYYLVNAGASYTFGPEDNGIVRFNVTNLTDKAPPLGSTPGELGIGTYDILGRRYVLSYTWRFK